MSMPAMDAPSVVLAKVMDNIVVDFGTTGSEDITLVCQSCAEAICSIEPGDTVRTLFNTVFQHGC